MKNRKIFLFVAVLLCMTLMFSTVFAAGDDPADQSVSSSDMTAPDAQVQNESGVATQSLAVGQDSADVGQDADVSSEDTGASAQDAETTAASEEVLVTETPEPEADEEYQSPFYSTIWALLPPLVAIVLALITKEVYSSLFIGILVGGLLWSGFKFEGTMTHVLSDGFVGSLADSYNVGILLFLVVLGALVVMMNKAGGSAAFGRWAAEHIKSRMGAQIATIILGILIFIDDYFNCLTVGSVMRPVTDKQNISRAKLSYLIDATAAPVCIIAPVSSWAAAVAGFAEGSGMNGFELFVRAIPYNLYALLTIGMMFAITIMKFDFGPMKKHEDNAKNGDIFSNEKLKDMADQMEGNPRGRVYDLVIPIVVLIITCVFGMVYSGGFFTAGEEGYHNFVTAFSKSDASVGLVYGSFGALIFAVIYLMCRRVLSFKNCMESIPEGFKSMVPAIMILTCAWTLKSMTDSLGAAKYIHDIVEGSAGIFQSFLPAIIFLIAVGLSFATGTSWGTFGILIPIVIDVFGFDSGEITIIAISACMAGAVCGDHCSPISDTTIMASAGAQCNHLVHVSTQLPYAMYVAAISFVGYIIAGFVRNVYITLIVSFALLILSLFLVYYFTKRSDQAKRVNG